MADAARGPTVYSIAAHRGFADALVAGLVPRYREDVWGLARLTLLLPSRRAVRTVTEAFVRQLGDDGGMLLPRMAVVGDLDLDEALGPLFDPVEAEAIPPAVDPQDRWLRLAPLVAEELGGEVDGATLLRHADDIARTMDRLLIEDVAPERLLAEDVVTLVGEQAVHWIESIRLFTRVQARWLAELDAMGRIDAATRRNRLFERLASSWRASPPSGPIVAAGVTSAAPALAKLLRVVADLPRGAVILPDLDLTLSEDVWDELGRAGRSEESDTPFGRGDRLTHPQYHLKLLLGRMGVAREEVQAWHRRGDAAGPPQRSHAISTLFLPPEASGSWAEAPREKRVLPGIAMAAFPSIEAEAQGIALAVREALEEPERRVALVTNDRGLATRVVHHLARWSIRADDSAGRPLPTTSAGRMWLLLAELAETRGAPVPLIATAQHPLTNGGQERRYWLSGARKLDRALRGPRPATGLEPLDRIAAEAGIEEWWRDYRRAVAPLVEGKDKRSFAHWLDHMIVAAEALAADAIWAREDGRALSAFVDSLRDLDSSAWTMLRRVDLVPVLREAMERIAVRPPYGAHPRVAILGLVESRMAQADFVICGGLNEGSWPASPRSDPVLAPPVLRALGVPGAEFRIGLAAHDLASAMGAPKVLLTRAVRDAEGPTIASRFLLRVRALLGPDLIERHEDARLAALATAMTHAERQPRYERPRPCPPAEARAATLSVTALDRLRSDPYQYYASNILRLSPLDPLDAEPSPAWKGSVVHAVLERWHRGEGGIDELTARVLDEEQVHPVQRALWTPRIAEGLAWVAETVQAFEDRVPAAFEIAGRLERKGVIITGKADRIDRLPGGELAIVDYKTGAAPKKAQVEAGYALQLGTLGLIAREGGFEGIVGEPTSFEYWSLAKNQATRSFGHIASPLKLSAKQGGVEPEEFLPLAETHLADALDRFILGDEPFTARANPDAEVFTAYDQLMRLEEWIGRE